MRQLTLTTRQNEILGFVSAYIASNKAPPTRAEIASHFGMYPNAAQCHLRALQAKGFISLVPNTTRNIRVTAP